MMKKNTKRYLKYKPYHLSGKYIFILTFDQKIKKHEIQSNNHPI